MLLVPYAAQISDGACLPACAKMVLAYYGRHRRLCEPLAFGYESLTEGSESAVRLLRCIGQPPNAPGHRYGLRLTAGIVPLPNSIAVCLTKVVCCEGRGAGCKCRQTPARSAAPDDLIHRIAVGEQGWILVKGDVHDREAAGTRNDELRRDCDRWPQRRCLCWWLRRLWCESNRWALR